MYNDTQRGGQQGQSPDTSISDGHFVWQIAWAWLKVMRGSVYMFTRINIGKRFIGDIWENLFATVFSSGGPGLLLVIVLLGMMAQAPNGAALWSFLVLAFGLSLAHRIWGMVRRNVLKLTPRHDYAATTFYPGTPWLAVMFRCSGRGEITIARYVEPALILAASYAASATISEALGGWLCFSALAMFFIEMRDKVDSDRCDDDLHDAQLVVRNSNPLPQPTAAPSPRAAYVATRATRRT